MYGTLAIPDGLAFRFSATLENVDAACGDLEKMFEDRRIGKSAFVTQLLMREALNNAVLHGSGSDARKTVECNVKFDHDHFVIEVQDEGDGFCWQAAIQQSMRTEALSGRGLPIMLAYADELSFNEKGNVLLLKVLLPKEEAV